MSVKSASVYPSGQIFVILLVGFVHIANSQVIKNCPGNLYSKDGYARWTPPTAEANNGSALSVQCSHASEMTLYTQYRTEVICTAVDSAESIATCNFNIFVADGAHCARKDGSPQCICQEYRPYFDPCYCMVGFSGLDCQYQDGGKCGGTDDPKSCDCSSNPCSCQQGFKGELCQLDFQAPELKCPEDFYTNKESAEVRWVIAEFSDNAEVLSVKCDPPSGSTFERDDTTNTTIVNVACSARDAAGNKGECSFRVIIDLQPPLIPGCPGNIYTSNATLEWGLDIGADDSHPSLDVTCDPQPGFTFTELVTKVVCSAKDKAGNFAEKNCTFQVFLADGISCSPGDANCECGPNNTCSCVDGYSGQDCKVKDGMNCVSSGNPGPSCACNGSVCVCADGFKGVTCEFDFQPPVLRNCPFGTVFSFDKVVTYRPMWTEDNGSPAPDVTCYPKEGSEFLVRRTQVMCAAQDLSGNKDSSCDFPVYRSSGSGCLSDGNNCLCSGLSNCKCVYGYLGPLCQVCRACQNGGSNQNEQCYCDCPALHDGVVCSDCNEATSDHCLNGGTFVADTCSCECQDGWTGRHCTLRNGEKCQNSASGCLCDGNDCQCNIAYEGPNCETCKPCQHNGRNQNSETCECECSGRFLPPLCEECDSSVTCLNGGTFDLNSCSCLCIDGWTGMDCSQVPIFVTQCPKDIIKPLDRGRNVAVVSWTNPTSNADSNGIAVVVVCDQQSGSEFREGTTEVKCTATDAEHGLTASCSFKVSIDVTEPALTCPDPISVNHQRWLQTSKVAWTSVTAKDKVSVNVPVSCIPPSSSVFDLGETTVVCSAFDDAMNLGSCEFSVEVNLRNSSEFLRSCWKCSFENLAGKCRYNDEDDEYECYCPPGYLNVNDSCEDIDECEELKPCDDQATCTNVARSFKCECVPGLSGDGITCRDYPYTLHPDIPKSTGDQPPIEKKIAIDIALAEESSYGCDWSVDHMASSCTILLNTFKRNVWKKYLAFSSRLLRIDVEQSDMARSSIPHTAVYDYNRMSESDRAISAQEFYDQTLASEVRAGKLGALKLVSDCEKCDPPKDFTNLCENTRPVCEEGFILQEVRPDESSCYYTCESLCSTGYCNSGSCIHNPPYQPRCRCPSNTNGPRCEPITVTDGGKEEAEKELDIAVIIGCSVAGGVLLVIILGATAYYLRRKKSGDVVTCEQQNGKVNEEFRLEEQ